MSDGASASGPYSVTVIATDSVNTSVGASQSLQWIINPAVNLTNSGNIKDAEGNTVDLPLSATDSAGNRVDYAASNLPPGLSINPTTGVISGTVAADAHVSSPYTVALSATDATFPSSSGTATLQWTVTSSGSQTVTLDNPGEQQDSQGDSPTLALAATEAMVPEITPVAELMLLDPQGNS